MHPQWLNKSCRRGGFTLIELLIVMGILTILATLSLTTVKALLKDQKITQSAQLVREYLETARLRALTSGRPVAVFLERVSGVGADTSSDPAGVAANYSSTRLTIGEVFPPYTGDELGVVGTLTDIDGSVFPADTSGNRVTTRPADNYADQVTFNAAQVVSGFGVAGTPGFISRGDTIEFEGYAGKFQIEAISAGSPDTVITFFNPPANYNTLRGAKALGALHSDLEANYAQAPPQIPLPHGAVIAKFRVYRRPSKSLVGSVALPRGVCVDLFCSGFGTANVNLPTAGFMANNAANNGRHGNYSRVAIMFSGDGRLSSVFADDKGEFPVGGQASQILHLLVGKTDQVPISAAELLSRRSPEDRDSTFQSNLLDPENVWVSCNPFTGEVNSSPVAAVSDSAFAAAIGPPVDVGQAVRASRALSIAGVKN